MVKKRVLREKKKKKKLDGVGPVDKRKLSTDLLHNFVQKRRRNVTSDNDT